MKKILIIGGAGFIGSELAFRLLKKKKNIHILDLIKKIKKKKKALHGCKLISGDITKFKSFKKLDKKYDIVYHLAAKASSSEAELFPDECFEHNVVGTWNVMRWANVTKPKYIIFSSSMSVYGKIANNSSENTLCKPVSIYGKTKLLGENILMQMLSKKTKVLIFRLFNVYGPNQDFKNMKQGMLSIYLSQIYKKRNVVVTGSLKRYRDFIYIDDVVNAFLNYRKFKYHNIYNIGSGIKTTVKEVIYKIYHQLKIKKKNISLINSSTGDTWGSYANIKKAINCGWKPLVKIDDGIKQTLKNLISI